MTGIRKLSAAVIVALGLFLTGAVSPVARGQETCGNKYNLAEYNAYTAATGEKAPAQQIKLLDDFVQKYPTSQLLCFIYQTYYQNYNTQKNFPKVIEYADKLLAMGEKAEGGMRYTAYYARAFAFTNMNVTDKEQALKARDAAVAGQKALEEIKKPENMSDEDFNKQKLQPTILFNYTAASACTTAKDFACATKYYKETLRYTPNEPVTWFRLGVAYLSSTPPQQLDGFWALARSVSLKGQSEAQVRKYLRNQMQNYQQASCENLLDAELNELVALAGSSPDRPASYKLPSGADLEAARKDMTIASVIADLKAGGEKGKVTWLASCGLEFPDVPGKLFEVKPGTDAVVLRTAFVTNQTEFDAATKPDMEIKVVGQPGAGRLEKDSAPRFTGMLVSFDPEPAFLLHWDKAKVNAEDIPAEKKQETKKPATKKAPARRPRAKKPPQP